MRNKTFAVLCLAAFVGTLVISVRFGNAWHAEVNLGESAVFSERELLEAADCVKRKFIAFKGCKMTDLWYDEARSNEFVASYLENGKGAVNGVQPENAIVFLSNFKMDGWGGDGSFDPNAVYADWKWIMIQDSENSGWVVDDWGY